MTVFPTPAEPSPTISPAYPFPPRYVEVHGARMHYVDEGEGDPILLLHGNPTWSYLWRNVIPHLVDRRRVIAPDLIGMGRSDKPDIGYGFADHSRYLEGFIAALGLRDVTLVLHDWGSVLGFHYAARHRDDVRGIAFMEANVLPRASWDELDEPARSTFRALRTPGIGWRLAVEENVFIEQLLPGAVLRRLGEEEMRHYREPFLDPAHRRPLWRWPNELPIAGEPADVAAVVEAYGRALQEWDVPKLLLHFTPGAIITRPTVEWCEAHLPNLTSVHVGDGIHFVQEDHPHRIGAELARWIDGL